ncbi:hypothetical protein PRK78_001335 [Emydomyces testavorans]|uniref:Aminoglycoside phosphotransferase domain-containing protein n=1 Tax=Emydomyces testavorans TaxID=2070801 RepID=A0AAF0IFE6_9EURO|nr:hypothetical protein PRK78_001335 [Emydomyces testavorans]
MADWGSEAMFRWAHDKVVVLSKQAGAKVLLFDDEMVLKAGPRVRKSEEAAMRLVEEHTNIPIPELYQATYNMDEGRLAMSFIPGTPLKHVWDDLDTKKKQHVCEELWTMINKLRQIPKPPDLRHHYLCLADGSGSPDPLVAEYGLDIRHPPLTDDKAVKEQIYNCYYANNGRAYENKLFDMLPCSKTSVFTHADISPHNIMFNHETCQITGIVDWERAGWYPDYWEYISIRRPSIYQDWQQWMDFTAPRKVTAR